MRGGHKPTDSFPSWPYYSRQNDDDDDDDDDNDDLPYYVSSIELDIKNPAT